MSQRRLLLPHLQVVALALLLLTIIVLPSYVLTVISSSRVVLGSTIDFPCKVSHDKTQAYEISWTFNGRPISLSNRIQQAADASLKIEQARNTDVGTYTCKVLTADGTVHMRSIRLDVIELPHAPLNVRTELNVAGGLVNVSWSPPFDGNSPIVRYVVEKRVTKSGQQSVSNTDHDLSYSDANYGWTRYAANISASQRFALLTNLAPAMTYQFRVMAVNMVGEGPPSAPTDPAVTIPSQPPAAPPIGVVGAARSSTSIIIQWQPPPNDAHNGPLFGYIVRYKLAGYTDTQFYYKNITNAAQLSVLLEDLIVWRNYEIQVGAYNEMGTGAFSLPIFIRTKEGRPASSPSNVQAKAINSTAILITWNQTDPQLINGINQGYKVQAFVVDNASSSRSTSSKSTSSSNSHQSSSNSNNINNGIGIRNQIHASSMIKQLQLAKELIVTPHPIQERGQDALFTDLSPFTSYMITVSCFTSAGDGPPNDPAILVTTMEDKPESVSNFSSGQVTDNSIQLIWSPPIRVNGRLIGYTLKYCSSSPASGECTWKIVNYTAETIDTLISGLKPDTNYKFELNAVTAIGAGAVTSLSVKSTVAPVEIGDLIFSDVTMSRLRVSWSPPVLNQSNSNIHLIGYQVMYETTSKGDFTKQVKLKITDNYLFVSGLKERVSYTFSVRAETTSTRESRESSLGPERIGNITTGPQIGSPPPVKNVTLTQSLTSVRLKWVNPISYPESLPLIGYLIEGRQVFHMDDRSSSSDAGSMNSVLSPPPLSSLSSLGSEDEISSSGWQAIVNLRNGPQTEYDLSFHHLIPSSRYTLRIMCINSKGISEPAFPVVTTGSTSVHSASNSQGSIIIIPSQWAQQRSRLPFYKEPWFVILCASMTIVFTIMVIAILCVQSKSYQYKKEVTKSTCGSRDALSDAVYGLQDEAGYASGLELRQNTSARRNNLMSEVASGVGAASAASIRSPPRPAPGSISYSDDEDDGEGDYCDTEAKESNLYGRSTGGGVEGSSEADSLTEKPSESSLSTGSQDSETDECDQGASHLVNHYANVNDTLRKGSTNSWKKQGHPYKNATGATAAGPSGRSSRQQDRDRERKRMSLTGEGPSSGKHQRDPHHHHNHHNHHHSRERPTRPVPAVPGRRDLIPSTSSSTSALVPPSPSYHSNNSSNNHHHHNHHNQHPSGASSGGGSSANHQLQQQQQNQHHHLPPPPPHHVHSYHQQQHGPNPMISTVSGIVPPPPSYLSSLNVSNGGAGVAGNSSGGSGSSGSSGAGGTGSYSNNSNEESDLEYPGLHLNGGRIIVNNMAGSRAPLPGFSSFV